MSGAVAGLLVGLVVLLLAPGSNGVRLPPRDTPRRVVVRRPRRRGRRRPVDPGLLVTEVAVRLRAGADPEAAFAATLRRVQQGAGPPSTRAQLVTRLRRARAGPPDATATATARARATAEDTDDDGVPVALRVLAAQQPALGGAVAACRLTHRLGAPMAEVLESCAHGLAEAERARAARAVALAGPRTTARLLQGMPVLGLALGALVGADSVAVLLDGGLGSLVLVAGIGLTVVGHRWVRRLVRAAEGGDVP